MVNGPHETVANDVGLTAGVRRYKPYPAYKDSGIEWFGEIPKHWEVLQIGRIGNLSKCNGGTKADEVSGGVPCIRYGDLYTYYTCFIQHSRSYVSTERASDYTSIEFGDILFAASGETIEEIGKSAVNLIDTHACCGGDIIRLRPTANVNSRFMGYATDSSVAAFQKGRMGRGITVMHVYGDELKYLVLAIPSPSEQNAIATYLGRETAKIDALVAEKERLIELLQEKRTALITRTVTKGIDPDATMKDSGVGWLGQIPVHWLIRRLKRISNEVSVGVVVNPSSYITEDGVPFVYGSDIREGSIAPKIPRRMSPDQSALLRKSRLEAGDLVTVRVGAPGVTAVVSPDLEGANCASVVIIRRENSFDSNWLCYVMNSRIVRYQVALVQYGAAQEQFNVAHAVEFMVPTPPLGEQNEISAFLDRETTRIDDLIANIRKSIDRFNELRTALISGAVTGKIDVRETMA